MRCWMLYGPPCVERGATPRFGVGEDETSCDVGCNGRPFIRLVNQMAEADVKSLESILDAHPRSEEHTSELQSPCNLVCRLLLEKKKKKYKSKEPIYKVYNR